MYKIRKADIEDILQIRDIYNIEILEGIATFDTEPKTVEQMEKWFNEHDTKHPILVVEIEKEIVGFSSLSRYSTRCAYSDTVEISLYVLKEHQGKGIGKNLIAGILKEGEKVGLQAVLARITEGNEISVKLHESFGFFHVGVLKKVGKKFGKTLDVYLMEKLFD